jgi:hypothetical protein
MCFSAEASFAAGAVLLPAGAYCVRSAMRKDFRYVPLAFIPLVFSLQQFDEGFVWLGLNHGHGQMVRNASVVFLFFGIAFWPFWIPLSLWFVERHRRGKMLLACLTVLSLAWLWLVLPVAADPDQWLSTRVVHHSIRYEFGSLPGFRIAPREIWRAAYLLAICVPLLICRSISGEAHPLRWVAGGLVAGLFAVSYVVFWYAFTSVWCFFAAILSIGLCRVFRRLPKPRGLASRSA